MSIASWLDSGAMTFKGWPAEAIEFYEGLEADNSKTYWQENKAVYEELVRGPMDALLAELAPQYGEGRIFRPYRDVRFSKDKSPYKTAIAATLENGGYISFSAEGLGAGRGLYMPAPDQLDRYRRAVADDRSGRQLVQVVSKLRRSGITVDAHDVLKTSPYNVVMQQRPPSADDGSLSRLAAATGFRYVNLEVRLGQTERQREMVWWLEWNLP